MKVKGSLHSSYRNVQRVAQKFLPREEWETKNSTSEIQEIQSSRTHQSAPQISLLNLGQSTAATAKIHQAAAKASICNAWLAVRHIIYAWQANLKPPIYWPLPQGIPLQHHMHLPPSIERKVIHGHTARVDPDFYNKNKLLCSSVCTIHTS